MRSGLRDARSVGPRTAFPGMGAAPGVVKEPVSGGSVGPGLHQSKPSLRRRRWRRAQAMSEILSGHHVISVSSTLQLSWHLPVASSVRSRGRVQPPRLDVPAPPGIDTGLRGWTALG